MCEIGVETGVDAFADLLGPPGIEPVVVGRFVAAYVSPPGVEPET